MSTQPRLLIADNEHQVIRDKCLTDLRPAWDSFNQILDEEIVTFSGTKSTVSKEGQDLEQSLGPAFKACFAYFITQEQRYADFAKELLWPTLAMSTWTTPKFSPDGRKVELISSFITLVWTYYLDFCADCISETEHQQIVEILEERSARGLLYDHEHHMGWYKQDGPINNWVSVTNANIGLTAILFCNGSELWLETLHASIFHMKRYLDWIFPDGSMEEAGGYWIYGIKKALMFLDALRINKHCLPQSIVDTGVCEWIETLPALKNTAQFPLAGILGDQFVMSFGDCRVSPKHGFSECFAMLAARCGDLDAQAAIEPEALFTPAAFIAYDPELKSSSANDAPPILKVFDVGWVVARSHKTDPSALFLAVRGGSNQQTHSHFDLGNFILWYNGQPLITELGVFMAYPDGFFENREKYYHASTEGHNCILVDGEGQRELDNSCEVIDLINDGEIIQFTCVIKSAYNHIEEHKRMFRVELNNGPVVSVIDEVQLSKPLPIKVLFHFDKNAAYTQVSDLSHQIRMQETTLSITCESDSDTEIKRIAHSDLPYLCAESPTRQMKHVIKSCFRVKKN